jgi:peptidoglycan/LPS O-acetylase OafA/YrhL
MEKRLIRSSIAILSACMVAVAAVGLAPIAMIAIAGQFSPEYLEVHSRAVFGIAYVLGTVVVGALAGLAVGRLAPTRPVLHMLLAALVLEGIGLALGGTATLPKGWQLLGLAFQVMLACASAALVWEHGHREPSVELRAL